MSGVSGKTDKDRPLDFKGFLEDLNGWDYFISDKEKMEGQATDGKKQGLRNAGKLDEDKGPPNKVAASESKKKAAATSGVTSGYLNYSNAVSQFSTSFPSDEKLPDATSEKELGNEHFKKKKYREAIECYSRSIVLSPTSVAFANRAMAYIKLKRFEEAENDCTEALNLDDRYVKAYSRRATARKELGKFKASMEDAEFAVRLEPNNQEVRKQYIEAKDLLEKEIAKKNSGTLKSSSTQGFQKAENSEMAMKGVQNMLAVQSNAPTVAATSVQTSSVDSKGKVSSKPLIAVNDVGRKGTRVETRELMNGSHGIAILSSTDRNAKAVQQGVGRRKQDMDASMQELASRAASRVMATTTAKNIPAPKSAYEFEVSWRALSGDSGKQTCLLKTILPANLPQIFKNSLSAAMLIEIIKCTATIFKEDTQFAVSILENLTKVPRFDMIVMCLSAVDHAEIHCVWEQVFSTKDIRADHVEILSRLRPKFCYGEWQAHILGSTGWPK